MVRRGKSADLAKLLATALQSAVSSRTREEVDVTAADAMHRKLPSSAVHGALSALRHSLKSLSTKRASRLPPSPSPPPHAPRAAPPGDIDTTISCVVTNRLLPLATTYVLHELATPKTAASVASLAIALVALNGGALPVRTRPRPRSPPTAPAASWTDSSRMEIAKTGGVDAIVRIGRARGGDEVVAEPVAEALTALAAASDEDDDGACLSPPGPCACNSLPRSRSRVCVSDRPGGG